MYKEPCDACGEYSSRLQHCIDDDIDVMLCVTCAEQLGFFEVDIDNNEVEL